MTLKNKNPWKLLSIGLLGVIAIGLLTPIDAAKPEPKENEATAVDCENPCIDETELTFDTATQAELDATNTAGGILEGTVAGLILDLAGEATARADADTAEATARADADTAEATTRSGKDTSIQSQITAIVDQSCDTGDVVTGIAADGTVQCAADNDTTYDETDFATSDQSCATGEVVTGVDANGAVTCATDDDKPSTYSKPGVSKSIAANSKDVIQIQCNAGDRVIFTTLLGASLEFVRQAYSASASTVNVYVENPTAFAKSATIEFLCLDV